MSNPLLKPGDPRFAKPSLVDAAGQNRFADSEMDEASAKDSTASDPAGAEIYAATAATGSTPYQPHYVTTAPSRANRLLWLAGIGLAGAACGASSLVGLFHFGWIVPLCALFASGPAWVLAYSDLGEMRHGGRDADGRPLTQLALFLGVAGMLACISAIAWMIVLGMSPLPDMF